jgi:NAD(P)-dependent dehydrogenase (short-subunit alcohol dehydrogenase family)
MELQLQNKIALVTGSTAGIGKSIAKTLAQEG